MQPATLSASSALVFEGCEARFLAENINKTPDVQGSAAALGTACHEALQYFVETGEHLNGSNLAVLVKFYDAAYHKSFTNNDRYDEGLGLMESWYARQDWHGRTVLMTEVKETFELKSKVGVIPFTYIWDRCDEWDDGTIEVIDYKSVALPVQPEELKNRIQPRAYALAAQIKFPTASRILVTYDLLRYEKVGAFFSRDDNIATWKYLQSLHERVLESDGSIESLNPECRWCVRKSVCTALTAHAQGGGQLGITDPNVAVDRRAQLASAKTAIQSQIDDLDAFIMGHCEAEGLLEYSTGTTHVKIAARGARKVESERAAKILGPELMSRYGSLGVTQIDKILKDETITAEQRSLLKQVITKEFGKPYVQTKPIGILGEDEG